MMTTSIREYDAAQALLDLHSNMVQYNLETNTHHEMDICQETENTENLSLSCTIMDVSTLNMSNNLNRMGKELNQELLTVSIPFENGTSYIHKKKRVSVLGTAKNYGNFNSTQNGYREHVSTTIQSPPCMLNTFQSCAYKNATNTREIATQTEESHIIPLKALKEQMLSLQNQLKRISPVQDIASVSSENHDHQTNEMKTRVSESIADHDNAVSYSKPNDKSVSENITDDHNAVGSSNRNQFVNFNGSGQHKPNNKSKGKTTTNDGSYLINNDLIEIGKGYAKVPAHILEKINWNSYTSATRKLLEAVFERDILATSSLTGKRSPAFPNKAAKERLNPALVNDIVQTVVERCSVPENIVRTSITTKCADESKMFRTRQRNKRRKASKRNRKNISPTSSEPESEDD